MTITINLEEEIINPLIQEHLTTGVPVMDLIIGAIEIRNRIKVVDLEKNLVGYGDKSRFRQHTVEIMEEHRLKRCLAGRIER